MCTWKVLGQVYKADYVKDSKRKHLKKSFYFTSLTMINIICVPKVKYCRVYLSYEVLRKWRHSHLWNFFIKIDYTMILKFHKKWWYNDSKIPTESHTCSTNYTKRLCKTANFSIKFVPGIKNSRCKKDKLTVFTYICRLQVCLCLFGFFMSGWIWHQK